MTVTLLSECTKFTACLLFILLFMDKRAVYEQLNARDMLLYAVPALLYMVDNNIVFVIMTYIDAAVMSIVWNCKIVITALLFRFVLKRQLTTLKWLSGLPLKQPFPHAAPVVPPNCFECGAAVVRHTANGRGRP